MNNIQGIPPKTPGEANIQTLSQAGNLLLEQIAPLMEKAGLTVSKDKVKEGDSKAKSGVFIQEPTAKSIPPGAWSIVVAALNIQNSQEAMKTTFLNLDSMSNERTAQIKAQNEDINNSIQEADKQGKAGNVGNVFGWIAASVTLIAGVALTVMTGGAAWPLLAAGILGMGLMIDSATGSHVMNFVTDKVSGFVSGLGNTLSAMGFDKAGGWISDHADQIATAIVAVTIVAAEVGLSVFGGIGAIKGLGEAAKSIRVAGKAVMGAASVVGGAAAVGGGSAGIASSVYGYNATEFQIDSQEKQKLIDQLKSFMDQLVQSISRYFSIIMQSVDVLTTNISSVADASTTSAQGMTV